MGADGDTAETAETADSITDEACPPETTQLSER
jgi:hypothetical protein